MSGFFFPQKYINIYYIERKVKKTHIYFLSFHDILCEDNGDNSIGYCKEENLLLWCLVWGYSVEVAITAHFNKYIIIYMIKVNIKIKYIVRCIMILVV